MTPAEFAAKVRDYANREVPLIAKESKKAMGEALFSELVLNTPVLTGHARHNWKFGVGDISQNEVEGVAGVDFTGDPVTGDEATEITTMQAMVDSADVDQLLYIGNYAPYIVGLDQGTSKKAPDGIVDISIHAAISRIEAQGFKKKDQ